LNQAARSNLGLITNEPTHHGVVTNDGPVVDSTTILDYDAIPKPTVGPNIRVSISPEVVADNTSSTNETKCI
jgi:hypothetical protein